MRLTVCLSASHPKQADVRTATVYSYVHVLVDLRCMCVCAAAACLLSLLPLARVLSTVCLSGRSSSLARPSTCQHLWKRRAAGEHLPVSRAIASSSCLSRARRFRTSVSQTRTPPPTTMTAVVAQGIPVTMPHAVRSSQPDTMPSDHVLAALAESAKLPTGLCATVARSVATHPLRIMIVDNSGSM